MKKYPLNSVEYYATFRDMIEKLPEGRENAPAISWFSRKGEENGVSLAKLRDDVRNLQAYFVRNGLAGTQIAILGENSYEWLLVYFAATYCGATAVCVDVEQSDETISQMLDMVDLGAIFVASPFEDFCKSIQKSTPLGVLFYSLILTLFPDITNFWIQLFFQRLIPIYPTLSEPLSALPLRYL